MVVDRFNVSMDDANHFKKVKRSHQWAGDASDLWERKTPPPGAHINLIYGGPQIHTQELEDHADFIPMGEKRCWILRGDFCQDPDTWDWYFPQ